MLCDMDLFPNCPLKFFLHHSWFRKCQTRLEIVNSVTQILFTWTAPITSHTCISMLQENSQATRVMALSVGELGTSLKLEPGGTDHFRFNVYVISPMASPLMNQYRSDHRKRKTQNKAVITNRAKVLKEVF